MLVTGRWPFGQRSNSPPVQWLPYGCKTIFLASHFTWRLAIGPELPGGGRLQSNLYENERLSQAIFGPLNSQAEPCRAWARNRLEKETQF